MKDIELELALEHNRRFLEEVRRDHLAQEASRGHQRRHQFLRSRLAAIRIFAPRSTPRIATLHSS